MTIMGDANTITVNEIQKGMTDAARGVELERFVTTTIPNYT